MGILTKEQRENRRKRWAEWVESRTVVKYEMNTQDSDWLAASRLAKTVDAGGVGAKAAQKELEKMEADPLVRPKGWD